MKKLIVANWKMNPLSAKEVDIILRGVAQSIEGLRGVNVVVCPPYTYIDKAVSLLAGYKIAVGAQDGFFGDVGAYTGEVSAKMLKTAGVKYLIVGHSERRALGESDELINKKVKSALSVGLKAVLCVGENVRDESGEYLNFIRGQIVSDLDKVKRDPLKNLIIAYEPVWAIGKDAIRPASPQDVLEMSIFIKKVLTEMFGREEALKIPIIYGGSVDALNCGGFLTEGKSDGLLVGRASLDPESFAAILRVADGAR